MKSDQAEGFDKQSAGYLALREKADEGAKERAEAARAEINRRREALAKEQEELEAANLAKEAGTSQNMFPEEPGDAMVEAHLAEKAEKAAEEVAATESSLARAFEEQQRRTVSTISGRTEEPVPDFAELNSRLNEQAENNEPSALANSLLGVNQAITNPEPEVPPTGDPITDRYLNNVDYVDNADNLQEADRQALADWINSQPAQANRELGNTNRTDLTDYEINNNQMVENTRNYQENVEVAEQFAQQTRDAEAAQSATIPDYLLRDSNAVPPTQPIEEKND